MSLRVLYKFNSIAIAILLLAVIYTPLLIGIVEEDKDISSVEKRGLSELPSTPSGLDDIKKFPQSFDAYYSDHFGLREWFNETYKLVKFKLGDSPSEDVTIGDNGWLFLGSIKKDYSKYNDPMGDIRNVNLYTNSELEEFAKYMAALNQWLNDQGVKYVFVIAPNKHSVYYDMLPDYIKRVNDYSATDQVVEYLSNNTNVTVVDLRSILLKKSKTVDTYYKTDTHWNHNGANAAQYAIMSQIEKMYPGKVTPEVFPLKDGTRGGGDLANFIGVKGFVESNPSPVFNGLCEPVRNPSDGANRETHTYTCHNQELNALIFRDSFFTALQPYCSRKFKSSTYVWRKPNFSILKGFVEKEKPDVIIEEWVERSLPLKRKMPSELKGVQSKKLFECSNKTIFLNDFKPLKTNKDIIREDNVNDGFKIKSVGNDPVIIFPQIDIKPGSKYVMHIEAEIPVNSIMQVFYSDSNLDGYPYTENRSIRHSVKSGLNDVYFYLDYENLGKHLRLDPISKSNGNVSIRNIEIKEIQARCFSR